MGDEKYLKELNQYIDLYRTFEEKVPIDVINQEKLRNIILYNNESEIDSLSVYEKVLILLSVDGNLFQDKLNYKELIKKIFEMDNDFLTRNMISYLEKHPDILLDDDYLKIFLSFDTTHNDRIYSLKSLLSANIPLSLASIILDKIKDFNLTDYERMNDNVKN